MKLNWRHCDKSSISILLLICFSWNGLLITFHMHRPFNQNVNFVSWIFYFYKCVQWQIFFFQSFPLYFIKKCIFYQGHETNILRSQKGHIMHYIWYMDSITKMYSVFLYHWKKKYLPLHTFINQSSY
jgi:hypothetical protein